MYDKVMVFGLVVVGIGIVGEMSKVPNVSPGNRPFQCTYSVVINQGEIGLWKRVVCLAQHPRRGRYTVSLARARISDFLMVTSIPSEVHNSPEATFSFPEICLPD